MEEEACRAETEKKIKSLLNLRNAIERNKVTRFSPSFSFVRLFKTAFHDDLGHISDSNGSEKSSRT